MIISFFLGFATGFVIAFLIIVLVIKSKNIEDEKKGLVLISKWWYDIRPRKTKKKFLRTK